MNFKKVIFGACACVLVLISVKVASENMESSPVSFETEPTQWTTLKINDFEYTIDLLAAENTLSVGTLNSDRYNIAAIGDYEGYDITINDVPLLPNTEIELPLEKLSKDEKIDVCIQKQGAESSNHLYINTLPDNYQSPPIYTNNPEPGYYYFNLNEYVYKMNTEGEIVFWRLAGRGDISSGGDDFKTVKIGGKQYYTFLFGWDTPESPYLQDVGYGRMQGLVLDENYQIVDNIQFLNLSNGEKVPLENHQFTMLGEGHYLLTAYVGEYVDNIPDQVQKSNTEVRVVASIIQEVLDGQVIFEWNSTDYPELYSLSTAGNDFYNAESFWADYAHLNSVVIDKDQNFICSFRNLDTIIKIDRDTGEILWKLGGLGDEFGLSEEQKFSKQHDARITDDGYITIFNNGNTGNSFEEGSTSIIKVKIDEDQKQILDYKKYYVDNQFSSHMGSAQETARDRFVIGWGGRVSNSPLFSEIDFQTGTILFEVLSPKNTGDFPDAYKVYKFSN